MIFSARVYYAQEQFSQAMKSNSQTPVSGDLTTKKPNGKDVVSSAEPMKRAGQTGVSPIVAVFGDPKSKKLNGKAVVSSAESIKRAGQTGVSPIVAVSGDPKSKKLDGKAVVSSAEPIRRTGGSCANVVSGELIPKKSNGKAVVSSSDEVRTTRRRDKGTVIQGFIPPTRIDTYLPHMVAGSLYRLNKFYRSKSKTVYRVAEQDVTIAFSWNSVLSVLENSPIQFLEDRFRFYSYEEFEARINKFLTSLPPYIPSYPVPTNYSNKTIKMNHPPPYTLVLSDKTKPASSSPKRTLTMKIKRPNTQQTPITISIALRTSSNGHLDNATISDMEYMLQYHEINFDSVTEIIDETTNYVAGVISTLDDVTAADLDIIVKVTDYNPQAWSRIDLDVYTIDLRSNRREPNSSEENDICAICHHELSAYGDLNTLLCNHSYHHQCI
ncbi:hypothetical protein YC2023_041125 [Brassica napus]